MRNSKAQAGACQLQHGDAACSIQCAAVPAAVILQHAAVPAAVIMQHAR